MTTPTPPSSVTLSLPVDAFPPDVVGLVQREITGNDYSRPDSFTCVFFIHHPVALLCDFAHAATSAIQAWSAGVRDCWLTDEDASEGARAVCLVFLVDLDGAVPDSVPADWSHEVPDA